MTTAGMVIGSVLVVAGFIWPDKVDETTQEVIKTSTNELLLALGVLIDIVTGLVAKDPVITISVK